MGVYHEVNFICPRCDGIIEVQSKVLDGVGCHTEDEVPVDIAKSIEGKEAWCKHCDRSFNIARVENPTTVRMRLVSR